MKLLRIGPAGGEKPAILDAEGQARSLVDHVPDICGSVLTNDQLQKIRDIDLNSLPKISDAERIGPCVAQPGKFVCVGLNYADHAKESGLDLPDEPVLFMKATSAIVGPDDDIAIPRGSTAMDWEVELGVIIGTEARYVSESDAMRYVAGFCVVNDLSARDFQLERQGQWVKGKSADTFGPIGPYLVTRDDVPDAQDLAMYLDVNGQRMQDGSTRTMVYGVAYLVSYISQFMSLQPGDIISTGTPPGVGMGKTPPQYLQEADKVELGIAGLGIQRQKVVTA